MATTGKWKLPPLSLLDPIPKVKKDTESAKTAKVLQGVLDDINVKATIDKHFTSSQVMTFYISPGKGVRIQDVVDLKYDFIRALLGYTKNLVFTPVVPGTSYMSLTIPRKQTSTVYFRQIMQCRELQKSTDTLAIPLGIDALGKPVITSIYSCPHVIVSGTVGSGKSSLLKSWICTLLMRRTPEEVRFILMDFKRVEYNEFNGIPHLLTPVILEPKKGLSAFKWVLQEMENRYKVFSEIGVRNIAAYNELSGFQAMPYIVIMIDEFSDIMAAFPLKVEEIICHLAQMARATGIHIIISTQRPSADVLTGIIRANIGTRIAFNTSSQEDSRTILDMEGAEKLCGSGDMLYISPDQYIPLRIQSPLITDKEIERITQFFKNQIRKELTPFS